MEREEKSMWVVVRKEPGKTDNLVAVHDTARNAVDHRNWLRRGPNNSASTRYFVKQIEYIDFDDGGFRPIVFNDLTSGATSDKIGFYGCGEAL